jgi:hypothetical protein
MYETQIKSLQSTLKNTSSKFDKSIKLSDYEHLHEIIEGSRDKDSKS